MSTLSHDAPKMGASIKIPCVKNMDVTPSGFKSYVHALQKYGFRPTKAGPYFMGKQVYLHGHKGTFLDFIGTKHRAREYTLMKYHPGEGPTQGAAGEVEAEDIQHDALYLCPVEIGTPAQTLYLDFDTGSADLWVFSTKLPANKQVNHQVFNPTRSTSFRPKNHSSWLIQYGDQSSASGKVGRDDVRLGGITVENQAIELAEDVSAQFVKGKGDGLLGLAFSRINTVKPFRVHTPVENMISQSDIPKSAELFTAYLGSWRDENEADKGKSFYTFGYIDQDTLRTAGVSNLSDIHYTPIDVSEGFWQIRSNATTINGKPAPVAKHNTAIIDTGTTLALLSDNVCDALYDAIPGSKYDYTNQGFVYPASTKAADLPVLQVDVGGKMFTIQKEDLGFADAGDGMVYGGVQSRGDLPFDILGDTFLKGVYAIFDQGNMRFGAVQRIEKFDNLETPPT